MSKPRPAPAQGPGWRVLAGTVLAVMAMAGLLFEQHRQARLTEINQQLSQSAARLGGEVELKFKNYQQLVNNVTRVLSLSSNDASDAQARLDKTLEETTQRLRDQRELATERKKRVLAELSDVKKGATQVKEQASEKEAQSDKDFAAYFRALAAAQKAADDLKEKTGTKQAAELELNQLSGKLSAQQTVASPPGNDSGRGGGSSGPPDVAPPPNSAPGVQAQAALEAQRASLQNAKDAVALAQQALDRATEEANAAKAATDKSARAVLEAHGDAARWDQIKQETERAASQATLTEEKQLQRQQAAEQARKEGATSPSKRYLDQLSLWVPPSHIQLINECEGSGSGIALDICVAKTIARINDVQNLEIVPCSGNGPTLSEDGTALLIPPSQRASRTATTTGATTAKTEVACGKVALKDLLGGDKDELGDPGRGSFDTVALLHPSGSALLIAKSRSNLQLGSLPGVELKTVKASTMVPDVPLGASKYRAFLRPIELRLAGPPCKEDKPECSAEPGARLGLVLCGLSLEDEIKVSSLEINLAYYLWFVLLLGTGLLALPLAKLWLTGPISRFRRFDVTVLVSSGLLLTLLAVVLVLAFLAHNRLAARADHQIETVASDIERKLSNHVRRTAAALDQFDRQSATSSIATSVVSGAERSSKRWEASQVEMPVRPPLMLPAHSLPRPGLKDLQGTACASIGGLYYDRALFEGDDRQWRVCERKRYQLAGFGDDEWSVLFTLNDLGYQQTKLSPKETASTPVTLASREYFRKSLAKETACLGADGACDVRGVPELVRSVTSGNIVLVVAQPNASGSGVAALETPLHDFEHLVLPLGMQIAVIDREGRIMAHSNNDAHHGQSIYGEVSEADELKAALATQLPTHATLHYLGLASRVRIEPLRMPGTGWAILCITPTSLVDVATTDMVVVTLFAFAGLWGIVVLMAFSFVTARKFVRWLLGKGLNEHSHQEQPLIFLRPQASYSHVYASVGGWMVRWGTGLCAVAVVGAGALPTLPLLLALLLLCGLALLRTPGTGVGQNPAEDPKRDSTPPSDGKPVPTPWTEYLPLTYLMASLGVATLFVAAPGAILFSGAYEHVAGTLVRAEQRHFANELRANPKCLQGGWNERGLGKACANVIASGEERDASHEPRAHLAEAHLAVLWPMTYLADFLPKAGAKETGEAGRLYRSEILEAPVPPTTLLESRRGFFDLTLRSTQAGPATISSSVPLLVFGRFHAFNLLLLVLITLAAIATAYVVAFRSLDRLFFIELLGSWRSRKVPKVDALLDTACPSKMLATYYDDETIQQLRGRTAAAELTSSPSSNGQIQLWYVPDLLAWLKEPGGAAKLEQALELANRASVFVGSRARFLLFSTPGLLEKLPESERRRAAGLLSDYQDVDLRRGSDVTARPNQAMLESFWLESSSDERRVLGQLAVDGYVNPHPANAPILEALVARGLLDSRTFIIRSAAFAELVAQRVSDTDAKSWEEADKGSAWNALRAPLTTGVASLLAALTVSKPELGVASALVPTLATGLPTIAKILSQMAASKGTSG